MWNVWMGRLRLGVVWMLGIWLAPWVGRAQQPGSLDEVFNPVGVSGGKFFSPWSGDRIVVSGGFLNVGSPVNAQRAIARFNADGTVDTSFSFPVNPNVFVGHVIRSDGRVLLYGSFTSVLGHPSKGVVLLNDDGSVDTGFRIAVGGNESVVAVSPVDGAVCYVAYAGGAILRVGANGVVDPGFNVTPPLGVQPLGIAAQPSGKLLVLQNNRIFRLNENGTRDTGYVETTLTSLLTDPAVRAVDPDGALYASSSTGVLNGSEFRTVVRLLPDGGVDPGFRFALDGITAGQRTPTCLGLEQSGRLLVSGSGSGFSPGFVRVLPTGAVDPSFTTPAAVSAFGFDGQGRIVLAGSYLQTSPTVLFRFGLVRLFNDNAPPPPGPPIVRSAPVGRTVRSGEAANFAVAVGGDQPITLQWRFNEVPIDGAVSNRLTIPVARAAQAGRYDVVASNPLGSVTSAPAVLEVLTAPVILRDPTGFTVRQGTATNLLAEAGGEPPLTLQWFHDGQPVTGGDAATLVFASILPEDGGPYALVASNASGAVTSAVARVTVMASKPEWVVITNVTAPSTLTNTAHPYRPDSALRVRHDGERGVVVLYPNALERWNDAGERQWTIPYEEANAGQLSVMALDRDGNTYVGGRIHFTARLGDLAMTNNSDVTGPNGHVQAFIAKVDPDGHGLWYRLYEAAGPSLREIAVDQDGGVVFAAGSGGRNGFSKLGNLGASESEYASAVVGKLSANGTPVFFRSFLQFAANRSTCEANSITADETGIYVSGQISFSIQFGSFQLQNPGPSPINWIGKLDANGEPKWIRAAGGLPFQGAPLASGGGRRWYLLPRDRVLQSWTPEGALMTNFAVVSGVQNDSALVNQLTLLADGSPMLIGTAKGSLTAAGSPLQPGTGRPMVWFGQWTREGSPVRGRLLATTTNENVNVGNDTVSLSAFAATAEGDVIVAGQFLTAMRFLGAVHVAPTNSFRADGARGGSYLAKVRQPAYVPEITQQPIAVYTLNTGGSVKIGIRAIGPEPLTYQWRRNGIPVPGATTNSFEFVDATVADAGLYDVVVTNPFGSALSEVADIRVLPPFTIRTQPAPQLVLGNGVLAGNEIDAMAVSAGAMADKQLRFTITNTTSPWFAMGGQFGIQLNGNATGGGFRISPDGIFAPRSGTYSLAFAVPGQTALRYIRFDGTNAATMGFAAGGRFDLHYDVAQPEGCCAMGTFTIEGGSSNATFRVLTTFFVADGNYQWQRNGVDLPGQTSSVLSLTNVTAADQGMYRVVITDRGYTEVSQEAELRVVGGAPLDPPVLDPGVFQIGAEGMTIPTWPAGYVLQRTFTLIPPAWETIATQPPVTIPFAAPGEFFQLVPAAGR